MSAGSPSKHSRTELLTAMQNLIVTPQAVTDPTILDSVAGFINDVVPTTGNDHFDSKDLIQWARFESLDFEEANFSLYNDNILPPSLILVLGYTTGVQVWAIPATGEAIELFSWRHGTVKVLRILPGPHEIGSVKKDLFDAKRPLVGLVDLALHGSSPAALNFYSLKTGEQVKQIKFKTQILDLAANRRSVVVTFPEKIAIFDSFTLEDKLTITSCYLSPGLQPNPIALGARWLAFAEKKLISSRRSSGGNEGEGVQSYTATVLHAAKSLGRGLRELSDAVASSLTGNQNKLGTSPNSPQAGGSTDVPQKGIVTILDVESSLKQNADGSVHPESIVAHFVAHSEAIVWLQFSPCGLLLLTADKRGHDFNLFRINSHPVGSSLAAVHHLYTLHRGDTSARVQDMCFSFDARWVTVSTLRGTTHIFPITPYGGNIGVRTHTTPHVVNKMSRFHRSAGLTSEGRSNSPVGMFESSTSSNLPYHNPRFSPFPYPTVINPLAQLRQPVYMQNIGNGTPRQGRQRLTSSSEDNIALRVTACFAPPRAWIDAAPHLTLARDSGLINKAGNKPIESLFAMNSHGTLLQYDLEPHPASHFPKEKICDDTPIELTVIAKAQWRLQRIPTSLDRPLPLSQSALIYVISAIPAVNNKRKVENGNDDDWLSQVEITTHAGPHRRLWMGPQFTFKTYSTSNGTSMSVADAQPLDLNRSKPVNMPITKANAILIESSSASSSEQSLLDIYRKNCEEMGSAGEHQIKEDLADAMLESPGGKDSGGRCVLVSVKASPIPPRRAISSTSSPIAKVVNPLGTVVTLHSDDEENTELMEESDDDAVIYANCDETLFRPLVTPKSVQCMKSNKAAADIGGNNIIMTKSLRKDTNVTVRVLNKSELSSCSGVGTNWEDPRIQDIGNNANVIVKEGEITDLLKQKPSTNDERAAAKVYKSKKSTKTPKAKIVESSINDSYVTESKNVKESSPSKHFDNNIESVKKSSKKKKQEFDDDSAFGLVNPLYNVLEECELIKLKQNNKELTESLIEKEEKLSESTSDSGVFNQSKTNNSKASSGEDQAEKQADNLPKLTVKSKNKNDSSVDVTDSNKLSVFKSLDVVKEISFPALDSKLTDPEFPPLEENFFSLENLNKAEKYEDAVDCGLPLVEPNNKSSLIYPDFNTRPQIIIKEDILSLEDSIIEENKRKGGSVKKAKKPKSKLGVKIGSSLNKDEHYSDKESTPERAETVITLPNPKRSWSSIASIKPTSDPWTNNNNNNNNSECSQIIEENYTLTLPSAKFTKSNKLLDIDTPEEQRKNIIPEKIISNSNSSLLDERIKKEELLEVSSSDLLKLSDKSSDDEKAETGSSPSAAETTESSDDGKILGNLNDDDGANREIKNISSSSIIIKSAPMKKKKKKKQNNSANNH